MVGKDSLQFALNHMTTPNISCMALLDLARELGMVGVELRNDLAQPLFDGFEPQAIGRQAAERGLSIFVLSEVPAFNDMHAARLAQVSTLISQAKAVGALAIGLIPRNDGMRCDKAARRSDLRAALREILPLLQQAGIVGLVEPLGFDTASLRHKSEAVEAIEALGATADIKIVHDTFHHHLAGDTEFFAQHTGIVHVSGVLDADLTPSQMRDNHRGLVQPGDRLGNLAQIRALGAAGYDNVLSFEAFAPEVHALLDARSALQHSIDYIENAGRVMAA